MTTWRRWSVAVWLGFGLSACHSPSSSPGLVITDVTVISPERDQALLHAYVNIVDGRIADVSQRPLRGTEEIDGTGLFLVPGLIDSHVHLATPPGFPAGMAVGDAVGNPDVVAEALAQDPRSYLYHGFTTVLDLVGSGDRTALWNALDLRPDAYHCGAAVIAGDQVRYVRFPGFSYTESGTPAEDALTGPLRDAVQDVVSRIVDDGAICVKTMYEPFARIAPGVEELATLVSAAHARGLPVFIHANRKEGQAVAVAAGVDVVVHGMWREQGEAPELDKEAREVLEALVALGIGYQPTMQVIVGESLTLDDEYLTRPELADAYPASLIEWYRSALDRIPVRIRNSYEGADIRLEGTIRRAAEVTRYLALADGRLLFGSDTPSDRLHTNPPGLNGRQEMENWLAAGVSDAELLRSMTIENARAIGLNSELGTVEVGKRANLLLLGANPLEGAEAYDLIETVILNGRPIPRALLSARAASGG